MFSSPGACGEFAPSLEATLTKAIPGAKLHMSSGVECAYLLPAEQRSRFAEVRYYRLL